MSAELSGEQSKELRHGYSDHQPIAQRNGQPKSVAHSEFHPDEQPINQPTCKQKQSIFDRAVYPFIWRKRVAISQLLL